MPSVLFVCTANQFRSPLAASIFSRCLTNNHIPGIWRVESAGTWTTDGRPALPVTKQNAERLKLTGVDVHSSRQVDLTLLNGFDLIIVMENGHKEALNVEFRTLRGRVYTLTEIVGKNSEDIPDPIVLGLPAQQVADELFSIISNNYEKIIELAQKIEIKRGKSN